MKKKEIGRRMAFGGIGAALSLVFIVLGYFLRYVSLSCTVLTSVGILLPLTQKYYRESVLAAIVAGGVGFLIVNIDIVPYAMASGLYVVLTVVLNEKFSDKNWKIAVCSVAKIGYSVLVFWVLYSLVGAIAVDVTKLSFLRGLNEKALYAILNVLFSLAFFLYDILLLKGYAYAVQAVKKILK